MIRTPLCGRLGIDHPILLGGMGSGTTPELVAAVSEAGGFGTLGLNGRATDTVRPLIDAVRAATSRPFGVNLLIYNLNEANFEIRLPLASPMHIPLYVPVVG